MSQRHIKFNVNELARIAAKAVGAKVCVSIKKYPDGMYNKAMLLTMDDGTQVVAKVPNPNAGKPHFTTASEVATMEFAREVLMTPAPKVLAWSSRAEENPVDAEYIIMEKVPGVEIEKVWSGIGTEDRLEIVKTIAGYQRSWTEVSFKKYGSLYYPKDLMPIPENEVLYTDADGVEVKNERFAIGPSNGREFIDDGRGSVKFDRGPWNTICSYHHALGLGEIASITHLPQLPRSPISLFGPGTYIPTRSKKLQALNCCLKLTPYLIPKDTELTSSHIWHGDLHVANIFVNPLKYTEVTGIIDWQGTELAPLYFHARQPQVIDLPNGEQYNPRLRGKKRAERWFLKQSLCALYNILTYQKNPRLYKALEFQQTLKHTLLLLPRNLLIDGEGSFLSQVAELEEEWEVFSGGKEHRPFFFTFEERKKIDADAEGALLGMQAMEGIRESLGELFPEKGCVRMELYEEALDALDQRKERIVEEFAKSEEDRRIWERWWPFGT